MTEEQTISSLLIDLRANQGAIWIENDSINLSIPEHIQSEEIIDFIGQHKAMLLKMLKNNGIFSEEGFLQKEIFRDIAQTEYPLSFAQERLWFIEQYETGSNAYHIPDVYELGEYTDKEYLKNALNQLINRHEVLRSTIEQGSSASQRVHEAPPVIEDIVAKDLPECHAFIRKEIEQPFDLTREYPIRIRFYAIKSSEDGLIQNELLLILKHHIASDGWSEEVFQRDLASFYEAQVHQKEASLPLLDIQYKDYALWQRAYLSGERLKKQTAFWKNKLEDFQELAFPTDYTRPANIDHSGARHSFAFSQEASRKLQHLSQRYGTTLNDIILSSFSILLGKYTGQTDIVTGSVSANRDHLQTEHLIGFFVNTQVNRVILEPGESFEKLVQRVHADQVEARLHLDLPFDKLVDELDLERDLTKHPIFQVIFTMEASGKASGPDPVRQDACLKPYYIENIYDVAKFDLALHIEDSEDGLSGHFTYSTALFRKESIADLASHYVHLIEQIANTPSASYSNLPLLQPGMLRQIIHHWNETQQEYPQDMTFHRLFEQQAQRTPQAIALVVEEQTMSYQALNEKSNQLARHIRRQHLLKSGKELQPDTLIAICTDRGMEMIVAILAVLKAGAAYVPIDPSYPKDRIGFILSDTQASIILSQTTVRKEHPDKLPQELILEVDLNATFYATTDASDLPAYSQAGDIAYVIYTSGTTGAPKGVMIEHRNLVNLVFTQKRSLGISQASRVLQFASLVFDASVWEIFSTLASGAQLSIIPEKVRRDVNLLSAHIAGHRITLATIPPSLLTALPHQHFTDLGTLIVAGESCPVETMNKWSSGRKLINAYGPTEATVCGSMHEYVAGSLNTNIGKPIDNTSAYILDASLNPVPIGVSGELYIGGAGVARGYLNRPELSAERFITNPFATDEQKAKGYDRIYKTGDLVRWLPDGNIEYIGRNDDQVKIRGFRIELPEIEKTITAIDGISQACVLIKERKTEKSNQASKYLVAYYTSDDAGISTARLQQQLARSLPEYMIPAYLLHIPQFPLTINGKLDKKALPDPEINKTNEGYIAPQTPLQKALCTIWQQVLGIDRIGIHDNFFRIGGDSILSIQVSGKIRLEGLACQVKDIFEHKTIARLAAHMEQHKDRAVVTSEQGNLSGELPLLPIQQWFFEQADSGMIPKPGHWNQSFLIRVPQLDLQRLQQAMVQLVDYHDAFRMRYEKHQDGSWKQAYREQITIPELKTLDVSRLPEEEIQDSLTTWQTNFDLQTGPLFQHGYLYGYEDGSARIFLALHHLIVDGVSWRIITQDLNTLYERKALPEKGSSYRQWTQSMKTYPEQHRGEEEYWKNILQERKTVNQSIDWFTAERQPESSGIFELDPGTTTFFLQEASGLYHTQINDLLLTTVAYALRTLNRNDVQFISLEGHGREDIDPKIDHSNTVGWFTSMFPVRLEVKDTIGESVIANKETFRNIPNKGIGFGTWAVDPHSEVSTEDLVPLSFNYLGQFDSSSKAWGIASESSGAGMHSDNKEWLAINILGMVSEGKLWFRVVSTLGENITKQLCSAFEQALNDLIEHCRTGLEARESWHSPADFFPLKLSQKLITDIDSRAFEDDNAIEQIFPASSLQQGFVYHALSQSQDDAYRVQILHDYHQALDIDLYIKAWKLCIEQYPSLRTAFNWQEEIVQVIYKKGKLNYQLHDISHITDQQDRDKAIDLIQQQDRKTAFDLLKPTLLRIHIIKQDHKLFTILKSEHHSITDGWSGPLLLNSLHAYYQALVQHKVPLLKKDEAYLKTQEYISAHKHQAQAYWENALAAEPVANDINALFSKPVELNAYKQLADPQTPNLDITGELYRQVKALAIREGITMNVVLQFVWHKLLQVYSNSETTIVGTTVSGRSLPVEGIGESVGLFINTLPLIIDWNNPNSILEQLHHIQQKITEINTHCFADLAKLQSQGERLFHSLLIYENYPEEDAQDGSPEVTVRNAFEKVDYPVSLMAFEMSSALRIMLQYDAGLVNSQQAGMIFDTMQYILQQMVEEPNRSHQTLSLLLPKDYDRIVHQWNDTFKEGADLHSIQSLFEQQAQKTPQATALVFEEQTMSYKALNEKSNQLARHIRKHFLDKTGHELKPDTLIALCLERSPEMIVAILAVLKAGAAYVPIDPSYPKDRIGFIISDTQASIILSQTTVRKEHPDKLPQELILEVDLDLELYRTHDATDLEAQSNAGDSAYVIYTSGTTGNPKGVVVSHRAVSNLILYLMERYEIEPSENILLFSNYVFDASVEQFLLALLSGNKLVLVKDDIIIDSTRFTDFIIRNRITHLDATPSYLGTVDPSALTDVKRVVFGAEYLPEALFSKFKKHIPKIINAYGPTEATISSLVSINTHLLGKASISNTSAYILDASLNPVPIGVSGELYIGGAGVARGYLNRPELSAERFITNPFATDEQKAKGYDRIYKTGDLVRWLPDGNIEYIGRNDDQVKIRGFRIELPEIEKTITAIDGISQACVLIKERKTEKSNQNSKYLVAYYTSDDAGISTARLQQQLARSLPEYMIPAYLLHIPQFPLTINGKLDKKALPDPEINKTNEGYIAPQTPLQKALCTIWQQVLGIDRIGIHDNFFRIGGDSILSIQVSGKIRLEGLACQVKDIFEHKTIARLAAHLEQHKDRAAVTSEQGNLSGELPLLPIQQWFFEQADSGMIPKPGHWNQSFLIRVPQLDLQRLQQAMVQLVDYHDAFRMRYEKHQDGSWKQAYREQITIPELKTLDVSRLPEEEIHDSLTTWQTNFDLQTGPLFQHGYLYGYEDGSARIFLALHHLIVDGVSWRIITQDLNTLYERKALPEKGSSYRQWTQSMKTYPEKWPQEESYWSTLCQDSKDSIRFFDSVITEEETTGGFELDRNRTSYLIHEAPALYHTQVNDLLLTAFAYALAGIDHKKTQYITLEGHGREDFDPAIDHGHTLGWFTSMFPLRMELGEDFGESIRSIKEHLRSIPNKGAGFGAFAAKPQAKVSFPDLAPVSFNYLGQFEDSSGDWNMADEVSGFSVSRENREWLAINMNGMITEGKLWFRVVSTLGENITKQLCSAFEQALNDLIEHCRTGLEARESWHSPADFFPLKLSQKLITDIDSRAFENDNAIEQIFPASSLQQGFVYHALSQSQDDAYRVQILHDYHQALDVDLYIKAWKLCIEQYPSLRTAFNWQEEIVQVIYKKGKLNYQLHDISHITDQQDRDKAIDLIQQQDRKTAFDLLKPTLLRIHIIKQDHKLFTILKSEHHSITDGWSGPLLLNSLHAYYQALVQHKVPLLKKDEAYLKTQEYISAHKHQAQAYWENALAAEPVANDINALFSKPVELNAYKQLADPQTPNLDITGELYRQVKALAIREGITMNVVLQFVWHKLLQVYSNSEITIVGTTVSGRSLPVEGIGESVGLFINTLPLIIDWNNPNSILEQLHHIQQKITEINTHCFADLAKLQSQGERLFHSLLIYENYPEEDAQDGSPEVTVRNAFEKVDYPVSLMAFEMSSALRIMLQYDAGLVNSQQAGMIFDTMQYILQQMVEEPNRSHQTLSLLLPKDYDRIVHQWNDTFKEGADLHSIQSLFEQQAQKTPQATALVFEEQTMSYKALNEKSNQLARHIRKHFLDKTGHELKPDTLIALCLERSPEMIVAILAVLKAGAAYVPIDPSYPKDRIGFIISDTQASIILSQTTVRKEHPDKLPQELVLEVDLDLELYRTHDAANLEAQSNAGDSAYVIYTSGTTGNPKGVVVSHRAVVSLVINDYLQVSEKDIFAFLSSPLFDASTFEIYTPLLNGSKLVIPKELKSLISDVAQFQSFLSSSGVSALWLTKTLFDSLFFLDQTLFKNLNYLLIGGEALDKHTVNKLIASGAKPAHFLNGYGPTESTTFTCVHYMDETISSLHVPIGKPIGNRMVYILDTCQMPVPVGVAGELYIGGTGLATGYLNRPELSREKFVPNPFASVSDMAKGYTRLYRSGDLARWLPDGNIEYIGRNDDQVKIRGFRIELGEIENALSQIDGIQRTCVLVRELQSESGTSKYLVAYYEPKNTASPPSQSAILEQLAQRLPEYMVPATLINVDSFPITANGKLDRRALPDPALQMATELVRPETELEISISHIYAAVLGIAAEKISVTQNFFRMGGNSILTIQLKQKLNQLEAFKQISIADLFRYNSIQKLVKSIQKEQEGSYKLQQQNHTTSHEIAIIGMSGAFSGAGNLNEFWQLIRDQKEGIRFHETTHTDTHYVPVEGSVKDIEWFDPAFWEISPNEARLLDPQIRKFMEHAWMALESAGYAKQRKQHHIGVFAGSGLSSYLNDHILNGELAEQIDSWEAMVSNSKDALATKTAYFLGLSGPANSINTACSTSLVAVVEACQKLQLGVCDMALAGGVSLALPDQVGYVYQKGMILSRDGHCRTFDKNASGTTLGSGAGVVLLKRLDEAIRDQDPILAVIKGYATNNDGDRKSGYTAPSVIGQSECIINAQRMAGIKAEQIDYVECHGTATLLGDPIEVKALHEAFQFNRSHSNYKTVLGAVKANIGHADSAAGIASLIKVCRMIEQQILPGQVNFSEPNPELQLEHSNFEILKENRSWETTPNRPRLAGVSSFGVGGTNAHIIMGEYSPELTAAEKGAGIEEQKHSKYIIPLSAKSKRSLELHKKELLKFLSESSGSELRLRDVVYTLQEKREFFKYRKAYVAGSIGELAARLSTDDSPAQEASVNNKVVFMFPGQGSQYRHMAQALYEQEPEFRQLINACASIANPILGNDLCRLLYDEQSTFDIQETQWTQVCLFATEYSLARYLEMNGLKADAYIGHSIGEFVAATLAGVLRLEDAIGLVIERGRLMQAMEKGSMIAIQCSEQDLLPLLNEYACEIAVINSPSDIVVSGKEGEILNLKKALDKKGIAALKLSTSHAYHSGMMEEAATKFALAFEGIVLTKPDKIFISNLSGEIASEEVCQPEYWHKQLRHAVRFGKGIDTLSRHFNQQVSFVEVGPGKGLSAFVNTYKIKKQYAWLQTLQLLPSMKDLEHRQSGITNKEDLRALLWAAGLIEKPQDLANIAASFLPDLPLYQFDFQKCWLEKAGPSPGKQELSILPKEQWFSAPVWAAVANIRKQKSSEATPFKKALLFSRERAIPDLQDIAEQTVSVILDHRYTAPVIDASSDGSFRMHPANEYHFRQLTELFKTGSRSFDTWIHACSAVQHSNPEESLAYSFYSLFLIRQMISDLKGPERLLVLTKGLAQITGNDPINPFNGTLVGAIRNINHEFPALDARIIDTGAEQAGLQELLAAVQAPAYYKSEELLALRFGKIWRERFEPVEEQQTQAMISDGDVILVTGGLGGVALALSAHIARQHKVTFILTSRNAISKDRASSDHNSSKLRLIEQIAASGSNVDIRCCNLANENDVQKLADYLALTYGKVSGIIHTAGVFPVEPEHYELGTIRDAFGGKVYGIANILAAIDSTSLKFLAMTSSLASVMGDINRIEYCAANSYLDYLAVDQQLAAHTTVLSINWPGWSDTGMAMGKDRPHEAHTEASNGLQSLLERNAVTQSEGAEIFYRLLQQSPSQQVVVSRLDIGLLKEKLFKQALGIPGQKQIVLAEQEYSESQYEVAKVFAHALGIDRISIHDDFFRIGGNSLMAIQVAHQVGRILHADIKVSDIFRFKTAGQLANSLVTQASARLVKPYYQAPDPTLSNLFFIHPGAAGCEVYQDLADRLSGQFNCIGIDNYNIHHDPKIGSLHDLASLYLSCIESEFELSQPVNLLGWSLGGRIAIEMAAILEKRGARHITLVILDYQLSDEFTRNAVKHLDRGKHENDFRNYMLEGGYKAEYVEKVTSAISTEFDLSYTSVTYCLKQATAILFRAVEEDTRIKSELSEMLHHHFMKLKANNLELLVQNLKVIDLDCHHGNILETRSGSIVNHLAEAGIASLMQKAGAGAKVLK